MNLTTDQISGLALIAFGAIIGVQALMARRQASAMRSQWPLSSGVIAEARPELVTDNDGTSWSLNLVVETPDERVTPRALLALSDAGLEALVAAYPVGRDVSLRRDPKHGTHWVDGQTPDTGGGWLLATSAALMVLGGLAWFGLHRTLFGIGG